MATVSHHDDIEALLDGVDFSVPVEEGEGWNDVRPSRDPASPPPAKRRCVFDREEFRDRFIRYQAYCEEGCHECDMCDSIETSSEWLVPPVDREHRLLWHEPCYVDCQRTLPRRCSYIAVDRADIVRSYSAWMRKWQRQPTDEWEGNLYEREWEEARVNDDAEEEYWNRVRQELLYLLAWENTYRAEEQRRICWCKYCNYELQVEALSS